MQMSYVRHSTVDLETVLPLIQESNRKNRVNINGKTVNAHSVRLRCFKFKGTKCVSCGIEGKFFSLEGLPNENPHLNLYAINEDGEEVLMTKDHIIPKSKGGKDHLDNMQTMCQPCNVEKGNRTV